MYRAFSSRPILPPETQATTIFQSNIPVIPTFFQPMHPFQNPRFWHTSKAITYTANKCKLDRFTECCPEFQL